MADVGLKIVIGADLSAVTDGMKVASNNIAQFGDVAEKTFAEVASKVGVAANAFEHAFDEIAAGNAALAKINASIDAAGDAAQQAGAKFDTLGGRLPLQDFNNFKKTVDQFKRDISTGFKFNISGGGLIPPIPPATIDSFNKTKVGANQAAFALSNVGRVAQDLPFGFIGIQNNLNPLLESFQRLKVETGSSKAALSALGQSLIGAGGIGLALSLVSSAFLIYQNGIAGFNKKTKEAKDKAEEFIKTLKSVGDVVGDATSAQAGDIAQVQALANVITDTNNAYGQRKRALEELKEVNKSYFGDLKLEESQIGLLTARVNEYTKAIVAQAVLKGFTDEISRVSVELAKQERALKKSKDVLVQTANEAKKAGTQVNTRNYDEVAAQKYLRLLNAVRAAQEGFNAQRDIVKSLSDNFSELNGEIDGAVKETLKFRDLNAPGKQKGEADGLSKQLSLLEKIRDTAKERQGKLFDLKDIDEATDKLAALEQQVGNLKLQISLRDAKKAGLPASEIDDLQNAIKLDTEKRLNDAFEKEALLLELPKLKFSQVNRLDINDIASRVFTSKEKIILTLGENGVQVKVKEEPVDITDLQGKIAKATGLDKKIPEITIQEARVKLLKVKISDTLSLGQFINEVEKLNTQLKEQIRGIFESGLSDVFAGFGEGLGESLSEAITGNNLGDGLKKAAQSILGTVGSVMQQLGKALITAAIKIKLLKQAFEKWAIANPALAIVAGIGLVAAGAALKNIKFDGPKFATGGIVSSPLIGQIGEQHRPEVIMPLDRLPQLFKQFGGDFGGGLQMVPIINNEGLYLAMKRGERSAGRKY